MNDIRSKEIAVSVICITYNHVNYIADALDGVIRQKVSFPIEVIVHDDASTDGTADIIREYSKKYPDIIVPIFQKVNQYSLGVKISSEIVFPRAKGKYIAYLEGDDCWIDCNKLQSQYDFLESHPSYSACLHNAIVADLRHDLAYLSEGSSENNREKTFDELLVEGGGLINPTASFFFRKEVIEKEWFSGGPVGDHFMIMSFANAGKVQWFSKPMSIYRCGTPGSFSSRIQVRTPEQAHNYSSSYIEALNNVESIVEGDHSEAFSVRRNMQIESEHYETLKYIALIDGSLRNVVRSRGYSLSAKLKACLAYIVNAMPGNCFSSIQRIRVMAIAKRSGRLLASHLDGYTASEIVSSIKSTRE